MIFDYITEFAGYLNDRGYAVTQNKISRFLSLKNEETDFTREAEIIPLMKLCFCRNKEEADSFSDYFYQYIKDYKGSYAREKQRIRKEHQEQIEYSKSQKEKIQKEIDHRKLVVRKAAIEAVKEARAQGDLSENFEYYAAKKDKNQNESRIRYLERMLKNATIIEDHTSEDEVGINTIVTLYIPDEDCEETYKLVTSIRSSSLRDMVSIESPLGKAIRGKKVGETATVQVDPSFSYDVVIKKIDRNVGDEDDQIRRY